ncbi:hypothetical protein [Francisella hispaniensis]|uniref:hypothetical protein n=1 Tax=Francisella hispaniensis TaxID=622488 RepID=UPI0019036B8B|nr:hypothetical protein [Francisella hispaniensis]MBK2356586.1 hypothetical protein [Francisella hispaniensis]
MKFFVQEDNKGQYFYKVLKENGCLKRITEENKNFFNVLNIDSIKTINFIESQTYKLEDDEWFFLEIEELSSDIKGSIDNYQECVINSSADNPTIEVQKFKNNGLKQALTFFIAGYKNEDENIEFINLQKITPSSYIKSKTFFGIKDSNDLEYYNYENILELKDKIDISIDFNQNKIFFKNFSHLKHIHKNFINLYREANKDEFESFRKSVKSNNFDIDIEIQSIGQRSLKKIKLLLDINKIEKLDNIKIDSYIKKYSGEMDFEKIENKYVIDSNKKLSCMIKVLEESFYESELTGEKRMSNSSVVIS